MSARTNTFFIFVFSVLWHLCQVLGSLGSLFVFFHRSWWTCTQAAGNNFPCHGILCVQDDEINAHGFFRLLLLCFSFLRVSSTLQETQFPMQASQKSNQSKATKPSICVTSSNFLLLSARTQRNVLVFRNVWG